MITQKKCAYFLRNLFLDIQETPTIHIQLSDTLFFGSSPSDFFLFSDLKN